MLKENYYFNVFVHAYKLDRQDSAEIKCSLSAHQIYEINFSFLLIFHAFKSIFRSEQSKIYRLNIIAENHKTLHSGSEFSRRRVQNFSRASSISSHKMPSGLWNISDVNLTLALSYTPFPLGIFVPRHISENNLWNRWHILSDATFSQPLFSSNLYVFCLSIYSYLYSFLKGQVFCQTNIVKISFHWRKKKRNASIDCANLDEKRYFFPLLLSRLPAVIVLLFFLPRPTYFCLSLSHAYTHARETHWGYRGTIRSSSLHALQFSRKHRSA